MLAVNPDIVCEIVLKAREIQAKEQMAEPESPSSLSDDQFVAGLADSPASNPSDDQAVGVLTDSSDDLTYQEVQYAIKDLEPDQQMELVALMWLGRGDFEPEEWEACKEEAAQRWTPATDEYLLGTPRVADFLSEGLNLLGYNCDE